MPRHAHSRPLLFLLVTAASAGWAQPAAVHTPPSDTHAQSPASAATPAVAGPDRSAFAGYRRFDDVKLIPWQQANDTVRAIGGWRAYAKEAQEPAPASGAAPNPPAGHHSQGQESTR